MTRPKVKEIRARYKDARKRLKEAERRGSDAAATYSMEAEVLAWVLGVYDEQ